MTPQRNSFLQQHDLSVNLNFSEESDSPMVTDDKPMLTPAMIRAARGLLGFDQAKVAELAGLTQRTISKLEGQSELSTKDSRRRKVLDLITEAFERKGIVFTYPDETSGPGVRLRREALSTDASSQCSQGQAPSGQQ